MKPPPEIRPVGVDFERLFEMSIDLMCIAGFDGYFKRINPSWTRVLGHTEEALLSVPFLEFVHPEDRERTEAEAAKIGEGATTIGFQNRYRTAAGDYRWLHWTAAPDFEAGIMYAVAHDITDTKEAEAELVEVNESLAANLAQVQAIGRESEILSDMAELLQASIEFDEAIDVVRTRASDFFGKRPGSVYLVAESGDHVERITAWNEASKLEAFEVDQCWGLRRSKAHVVAHLDGGPRCSHLPRVAPTVCAPMLAQGEPLGLVYSSGTPTCEVDSLTRSTVAFADQLALGLANLRLRDTLRQNAIRDAATGLYNRRYLEEAAAQELSRAERTGKPVGVMMIDIDHFKQFNDTHGHHAGDVRLAQVARFLDRATRDEDIVSRYGGEEFVVVMPEASLDHTSERADQLRKQLGVAPFQVGDDGEAPVTVSVGVAGFPVHGESLSALLRAADQALYESKRTGRDRVTVAASLA